VLLVIDQQPVGALSSNAADEPLGIRVCPRRAWWGLDHVDAFGGEHGVEGPGELGVPVPDQEPQRRTSVPDIRHQVAGLLRGPGGGRVGRDAADLNPTRGDLHDEQYVQTPQHHRVEVEEVRREQPGRLRPQERPPARINLAWRRADPAGSEDTADGPGADPVAEANQFALDAPMPQPGFSRASRSTRSRRTSLRGRPGRFG
jgi:hypothetical protein